MNATKKVVKKAAAKKTPAKPAKKLVSEKLKKGYSEGKAASSGNVSCVQGMIQFAYGIDVDALFGRDAWDGQIDYTEDLKCGCEIYFAGEGETHEGLDWDDVADLVQREELRVVGVKMWSHPSKSKAPKTLWVVGDDAAALYDDDAAWGHFFGIPSTVAFDLMEMVRRSTPDYDDDPILLKKYEGAMTIDLDEDLTKTLRNHGAQTLAFWCIVAQHDTTLDAVSAPGVEEGNEKSERMGLFIAPT